MKNPKTKSRSFRKKPGTRVRIRTVSGPVGRGVRAVRTVLPPGTKAEETPGSFAADALTRPVLPLIRKAGKAASYRSHAREERNPGPEAPKNAEFKKAVLLRKKAASAAVEDETLPPTENEAESTPAPKPPSGQRPSPASGVTPAGRVRPSSASSPASPSPVSAPVRSGRERDFSPKTPVREPKTLRSLPKAVRPPEKPDPAPPGRTAMRKKAVREHLEKRKRALRTLLERSGKKAALKAGLLLGAAGLLMTSVLSAGGAFGGILSSATGLFFSNKASDNRMTELIRSVDTGFQSYVAQRIAELAEENLHDELKVLYGGDADGDSAAVSNWNDVLAVYAVYATTGAEHPTDVLTVKPENEALLDQVFHSMNSVSFSVSKQEKTVEGSDGTTVYTTLTIHVNQQSLTYRQGADLYGFDSRQTELLEEMMSSEYDSFYAALIGVDVSGGADLTALVSGLPANARGSEIVKAALTKLGSPYVMGAKGDRKFDCSGLVYWSVRQVDESMGARLYTNAAGQAKYLLNLGRAVGRNELQPGDLVFWQNLRCSGCGRYKEIHHTGIYAGGGKVIEASSSRGRVVLRDLWSSSNYPIYCFCRVF